MGDNSSISRPKLEKVDKCKCSICDRELAKIDAHYGCNRCEVGPICLGCVLRHHRDCDCFNLFESLVRFVTSTTNWISDTCNLELPALLKERCRLQNAIGQVQNQLPTLEVEFAGLVERKHLKEALKIAQLYDRIERSVRELGVLLHDLNLYVSRQRTNQTSQVVVTFKRAKEYFDRLSGNIDQLRIGLLERKIVDKLLQLRILFPSMRNNDSRGSRKFGFVEDGDSDDEKENDDTTTGLARGGERKRTNSAPKNNNNSSSNRKSKAFGNNRSKSFSGDQL